MQHQRFNYATLDEVRARAREVGAWLPLTNDISILSTPVTIAGHTLPNRIALQPMEGTDGTEDGAPGELTVRRYHRFAEGGAALIWFEAVATAPEVRASAHQLRITPENVDDFKRLVGEIKELGLKRNGFEPMVIMQCTNSGRYSKPHGYPEPLIAYNNPVLEGDTPIDPARILTDDQLKHYEELFGPACKLAQQAGFDGMDVKCCHRYLACELLSAYTRPGKYGGSFENRTRFLLNAVDAARAEAKPGFIITSRLNVYDGFVYPYGFGVVEGKGIEPHVEEGERLAKLLHEKYGYQLLDITIGNPYKNPHVNRPYDNGAYIPDEHPLYGEGRMMECVARIQAAVPDMPIIGSAYTYLRQFAPNLAAGMIASGHCAMAGFGRMAFAYPDFANDIVHDGALDKNKVCITCGQCAALLRAGIPSGCVVRDRDVYKPPKQ